jgi:excisionase family DNA binding protein
MNLTLGLPKDFLLISRKELKETLIEIMADYQLEMANDEIMTIKETADFLKVSVPTVRAMITKKEIPYFQNGQVIRLSRLQITEWLRENFRNSKGEA